MTTVQAVKMSSGLLPEPWVTADAYFFVDDQMSVRIVICLDADIVGLLPGDSQAVWSQFGDTTMEFSPVVESSLSRAVLRVVPAELLASAWQAAETEVRKAMERAGAAKAA